MYGYQVLIKFTKTIANRLVAQLEEITTWEVESNKLEVQLRLITENMKY